jgi:hypothetical protein
MVTNSFGNISWSQWEGSTCIQNALIFFYYISEKGGAGEFFSFFLCSQLVLFKFPMCSTKGLSIAPRFNPIYFAQSPPLLTYLGGPKGEALHLSIKYCILGSLYSFNFYFFCNGPIKLVHSKNKKKLDLFGNPN